MRRSDGTYILLDFGLAVDGKSDVVGSSRKKQGAIEFKSPDRSNGLDPTPQDDIYSFGCVLYAMLTGKPPFPVEGNATTLTEAEICRVFLAHRDKQPPAIERDDVPQWLVDMTMRCLAKNPAERYADGYELYQEIVRNMESATAGKAEALAAEKKEMAEKIDLLEKEKQSLAKNLDDLHLMYDKEKKSGEYLLKMLDEKSNQNKTLTVDVDKLQVENDWLKKNNKKNKQHRPSWLLFVLLLIAGVAIAVLATQSMMPKQETAAAKTTGIPSDSVDRLNNKINDLQKENEELSKKVSDLSNSNKNIAALNDEIASLKSRIEAINSEKARLERKIDDIKQKFQLGILKGKDFNK